LEKALDHEEIEKEKEVFLDDALQLPSLSNEKKLKISFLNANLKTSFVYLKLD